MKPITNIAAYKFASLSELKPLREHLLSVARQLRLKGTILLSTEGINLFIAGEAASIDAMLAELRAIPGLEDLKPKFSESAHQPFTRMLVRIKKEIIAFGVDGIDPARRTSPKLPPAELKRWLDEGRPITLLDTRNDYEVKLGTFRNALTFDIDHFRKFPDAVKQLPVEMKKQPIVMFCTGGIRCEKAGPYMEREGFEQIFQLDGGILKYFEDCGNAHYDGECFVFDQRVGVDPSLQETASDQCFACLAPLRPDDMRDERYVPGKSCPHCFVSSEEKMARSIAERHEAIRRATTPLPGSHPYDNLRPLDVPSQFHGQTLLDCVSSLFDHIPKEEWEQRFALGRLRHPSGHAVPACHRVSTGERYLQLQPATIEPDVNANIRILYEDPAIIVVDKPAPLPMHPCGRFNRNTLHSILRTVYAPNNPRAAHRLDANTTGVVVFSRTRHVAGLLQPQFERGNVTKVYLARVIGHPQLDEFACDAPIGAVSGDVGSRAVDEENGLPSRTEFTVLQRYSDGTTLLEARPLTGRTNQIRVHLWHLGHPIVGDPTYLEGGCLGETQTSATTDAPLCLHAQSISFTHPISREKVRFESAPPEWAALPDAHTVS